MECKIEIIVVLKELDCFDFQLQRTECLLTRLLLSEKVRLLFQSQSPESIEFCFKPTILMNIIYNNLF